MTKKEEHLKEQLIRLQNYYRIKDKKLKLLEEERIRTRKLIEKQEEQIKMLKKKLERGDSIVGC